MKVLLICPVVYLKYFAKYIIQVTRRVIYVLMTAYFLSACDKIPVKKSKICKSRRVANVVHNHKSPGAFP